MYASFKLFTEYLREFLGGYQITDWEELAAQVCAHSARGYYIGLEEMEFWDIVFEFENA